MNLAVHSFRIDTFERKHAEINRSPVILRTKQSVSCLRSIARRRRQGSYSRGVGYEFNRLPHSGALQVSDQQELLESYYHVLCEEQLREWWTDETDWPKQRDLKTFLDWFEVEFHSLVFDLCNEPIRVIENGENTQ